MEEGDNRLRPGVLASISHGTWDGRVYYCARSYGPVLEQLTLLALTGSFSLPSVSWLSARYGLGLLEEHTSIHYSNTMDQGKSRAESRYNLGVALGLRASFIISGDVYVEGGWDSYLFPAGLSGGLFLATGRKEVIYLGSGIRW